MGILQKDTKNNYMEEQKRPNWTPYAIVVIACLVLCVPAFWYASYRPTASGQTTWEVIGGILIGIAILGFILGFVGTRKRKL